MILIVVFLSATIICHLFYRWGFMKGFETATEEAIKIVKKEIDEFHK